MNYMILFCFVFFLNLFSLSAYALDEEAERNEINLNTENIYSSDISEAEILQGIEKSGTVTDIDGVGLPGVNVVEKGTNNGTITDINGNYTIIVSDENAILTFSFIGYLTEEIPVNDQTQIDFTMIQDIQELESVVVVGYGTVKKRDLIGAVDQIGSEALEGRVNPSITRSLQGQIPGLNITLSNGKPSSDPSFNVRGTTSIGAGGSALVLVDGVPMDASTVNPDDIESVSVLKDASSAAVYGARGAFGVILITTKQGRKGSPQVTFDGNASYYTRTGTPSLVTNGYEWTTNALSAYQGYNDYSGTDPITINNIFPFSRDWYEELKRRNDNPELPRVRVNNNGQYEYFGNTDWDKLLYKDWAKGSEYKIGINGGTEAGSYYLSGRYFKQEGIYRYGSNDFDQYNFRVKGDLKLGEKWKVNNNSSIDIREYNFPLISYGDELVQRNMEHHGYPVAMMFNPDGSYTHSAIYCGVGDFHSNSSFQNYKRIDMRNTVGVEYKPLDVLVLKGNFTYFFQNYEKTRTNRIVSFYEGPEMYGEKGRELRRFNYHKTNTMSSNITLDYNPNLGQNHILKLLTGLNVEDREKIQRYNRRDGFLYADKPNFDLMEGENMYIEERSNDWSFLGMFFRANYIYKDRYLFEFSTRYDGSSKFPSNEQWCMFPSGSFGWRISEESFMKNTKRWLSNLKLRLSVGSLGNGNVDPYDYEELMTVSYNSLLLNGRYQKQTEMPSDVPDNLTWEKVTTYDIGMDADLFDGRLNLVIDVYRRNTTDMYTYGPALPEVYGADAPKGNYADLKTEGWELSIGYRNSTDIGKHKLSYNFKAMIWDSQSWITKYIGNDNNNLSSYYEGQKIGDVWGYTIEGLFESDEDVINHASQDGFINSKGKIWLPGDIKFEDIDGSGNIDWGNYTLDDHGDFSIVGNTEARYSFGFNMGANYAGFGLNVFLQGVAKRDWYPQRESGYFWGQYNRYYGYFPTDHIGNQWIEGENEDPNAYFPRLRSYIANSEDDVLGIPNNRYMQNAAYIRVKNITLDYSLPQLLIQKLNLNDVKLYVSGENLWTLTGLTKHTKNFDPEVIESGDSEFANNENSENGYSYPMLKQVTVGLKVVF